MNKINNSNTPVEAKLFQHNSVSVSIFIRWNKSTCDARLPLVNRAKEEVFVPFKFQSFAAGNPHKLSVSLLVALHVSLTIDLDGQAEFDTDGYGSCCSGASNTRAGDSRTF